MVCVWAQPRNRFSDQTGVVDGITPETCGQCGFDARRWRPPDVAWLFSRLGWWWTQATRSFGAEQLNYRPAAKVWSALEYGLHSALAAAVLRYDIECMLAQDGCAILDETVVPIGQATDDDWAVLDKAATLADISREGSALAEVAGRLGAPWGNVGHLPDQQLQAGAVLMHAAHDSSHHFMDVSRGLAAISNTSFAGVVDSINVAGGGVPRRLVRRATVTLDGLDGGRPRDHKHPQRPFEAVRVWSSEVIEELAAAGHLVVPGSAGENLTLTGLPWASLRPGARLRFGGGVLVELSFDVVPRRNEAQWFFDGDYSRISYRANPERVRWYGWVREGGEVQSGDEVLLEI
jgi:MOSC domain-containing protein YiiM